MNNQDLVTIDKQSKKYLFKYEIPEQKSRLKTSRYPNDFCFSRLTTECTDPEHVNSW